MCQGFELSVFVGAYHKTSQGTSKAEAPVGVDFVRAARLQNEIGTTNQERWK